MDEKEKAEELYKKAFELCKEENFDEAINLCHKSTSIKLNSEAFDLLGQIYLNRVKEAISNNLEEEQKTKDNFNRAIENFKNSIYVNLNYIPGYNKLAVCMILAGDKRLAENFLNTALYRAKSDEDLAETHFNLGSLFQIKMDFQKALIHLKEALKLNPNHLAAKNLLKIITGPLN